MKTLSMVGLLALTLGFMACGTKEPLPPPEPAAPVEQPAVQPPPPEAPAPAPQDGAVPADPNAAQPAGVVPPAPAPEGQPPAPAPAEQPK